MPWSGGVYTRTNGTYNGSTVWASDAAASVKIQSSRHDTHDQDLADGINACMAKDGSNIPASLTLKDVTIGNQAAGISYNITWTVSGTNTSTVIEQATDIAYYLYTTGVYPNSGIGIKYNTGNPSLWVGPNVTSGAFTAPDAYQVLTTAQLNVNGSSSATTPGSVVKKLAIYDISGTLLGYLPIYSSIT